MKKQKRLFYLFLLLVVVPALFSACQDDPLSFKDMADGASFETEWIPTVTLDAEERTSDLVHQDQLVYVKSSVLRYAPPLEGYYLYSSSDDTLYKILNPSLEELDPNTNPMVKLKGIIHVAKGVFWDSSVMVDPYIKLEIESVTLKK